MELPQMDCRNRLKQAPKINVEAPQTIPIVIIEKDNGSPLMEGTEMIIEGRNLLDFL